MNIINPFEIPEEKTPLIMLVDNRRSLIGFLIKNHSKGNYNHACCMYKPNKIASQDWVGYRERCLIDYMKPHILLKFWAIKDMTFHERAIWRGLMKADLDAPWARRRYDFLGCIGQLLGIPWLQNPHTKYCSEKEALNLRSVFDMDIPKYPTPSSLNKLFHTIPRFELLGYYFQD